MKDAVFVLGAGDVEMNSIETVITDNGFRFIYATKDGERVSPRSAYEADPVLVDGRPVILVECRPINVDGLNVVGVCDHHNPGDPGFDSPPEKFLEGSSIGQAILQCLTLRNGGEASLVYEDGLWWSYSGSIKNALPMDWVLTAAGDHCQAAAYKGKCPGVSPEALLEFRLRKKAEFRSASPKEGGRMSEEDILSSVKRTIGILKSMPKVSINGHEFIDCRGTEELEELPEASSFLGLPVMYMREDQREGRIKVGVLNGSKEATAAWMGWASEEPSLEGVYGNPTRGYAGAYLIE